ncbi:MULTISPECIES: hypothetical protein [Pedobacter]|uniref:hypothetical protein n=1 Tax=Pedobacter TaxID=84567 RepID=UPI001E3249FB|nr:MULTISPECIES: hypothetical protein [Pedobacter]
MNPKWRLLVISSITVFLIVTFYILTKDKSGEDRFKKGVEIDLPNSFNVIREKYYDMGQDDIFNYDIKLDKKRMESFVENIKKSRFYFKDSIDNPEWERSLYYKKPLKAIWIKTPKGYFFKRIGNLAFYSLRVDTVTNVLNFQESLN